MDDCQREREGETTGVIITRGRYIIHVATGETFLHNGDSFIVETKLVIIALPWVWID